MYPGVSGHSNVQGKEKEKALQHREGTISHLEEFVEAGTCPFEGDSANAIRMFERSVQAPKGRGVASKISVDVLIDVLVVDGNLERA
jgi:hypothetical protein